MTTCDKFPSGKVVGNKPRLWMAMNSFGLWLATKEWLVMISDDNCVERLETRMPSGAHRNNVNRRSYQLNKGKEN